MKGYMYILACADGSYYTGSTKNLELRLQQHQNGEGANHTKKRLPVKLLYFEEFQRIDHAFYREKQVQGWNRKKKEALMRGDFDKLKELSKNYTEYRTETAPTRNIALPELVEGKNGASTSSAAESSAAESSAAESSAAESSAAETCPAPEPNNHKIKLCVI